MSSTIDRPATKRPSARASGRGPARPRIGEPASRAHRVALGKDARAVAPLESHAQFESGAARDPVGLLLGQAQSRVPELVPIRHGRMLVSAFTLLSGCCATDGRGPGHHADVGAVGAAVRRRAPVQFRRVRLAGAASGLQCQRLRRDPARPVRVGRQTDGHQLCGCRTGQRVPDPTKAPRVSQYPGCCEVRRS